MSGNSGGAGTDTSASLDVVLLRQQMETMRQERDRFESELFNVRRTHGEVGQSNMGQSLRR
jgi:hypothetical protein